MAVEKFNLHDENERLRARVADLEAENARLRGIVEKRESVVFWEGAYWTMDAQGGHENPFCPTCYKKDDKLLHMTRSMRHLYCEVCKTSLPDPEPPPEKSLRASAGLDPQW